MADVSILNPVNANGTATPATVASGAATQGNLLICVIAAIGTSPTIATPTGDAWQQVQKNSGAVITLAVYALPNAASGVHTPSSVLGGTVTGWIIEVFEFSQCGANCAIQGKSTAAGGSITQLSNAFPTTGNTLYNELFIYVVARATATITAQNTFNSPLVSWSASQQPQAGVQGISLDFYWASGLGQGVGQYPQASGILNPAVAAAVIAGWFNTIASQPGIGEQVGGVSGSYVPNQFQGMIGG